MLTNLLNCNSGILMQSHLGWHKRYPINKITKLLGSNFVTYCALYIYLAWIRVGIEIGCSAAIPLSWNLNFTWPVLWHVKKSSLGRTWRSKYMIFHNSNEVFYLVNNWYFSNVHQILWVQWSVMMSNCRHQLHNSSLKVK